MVDELSVQSSRRSAACLSCFLDGVESPEILPMTSGVDIREVSLPIIPDPEYALNTRRIIWSQLGVHSVCGTGGCAEIDDPVVCLVTVDMVDDVRHRLAIDQQPSEAMQSKETFASDSYTLISIPEMSLRPSCRFTRKGGIPEFVLIRPPEVMRWPIPPDEDTCIGIVVETFADEGDIGQTIGSHGDLQTGRVVRDDVVLIPPRRSDCSIELILCHA